MTSPEGVGLAEAAVREPQLSDSSEAVSLRAACDGDSDSVAVDRELARSLDPNWPISGGRGNASITFRNCGRPQRGSGGHRPGVSAGGRTGWQAGHPCAGSQRAFNK